MKFFTCFFQLIIGVLCIACSDCPRNDTCHELDVYGGWKAKPMTKTGYFHTENDSIRWWFVTPDGHAFLSFGINHYQDGLWNQTYNHIYWDYTFGAKGYMDSLWGKGFRKEASEDLHRLGINTLGWHTVAPTLTDLPYQPIKPYLRSYQPIILDHYRSPDANAFIDVFSEEYVQRCKTEALKVAAPYRNDTMLLGYCMSDCPIFTEEDIEVMDGSTSWMRTLRNLSGRSAGKQAYVELMKDRYSSIQDFNMTYDTKFKSWYQLLWARNWRPDHPPLNSVEAEDNFAFMLLCVDKYYQVAKEALLGVDPNHLFLGDKLNANTNNLEAVIHVAAKYVDAIVYQFYGSTEQQVSILDRFAPQVQLPFINGNVGFSVPTEMMPNPYGTHASDQAQRAEWLLNGCQECFARPEFIGWHMCGIIDTWKTMPGKTTKQYQGLMTITGDFYIEMELAVQKISRNLYLRAIQQDVEEVPIDSIQ